MMDLVLERKEQDASSGEVTPGFMITPALDENYWSYRVMLNETQAIVGFPKFGTIGVGFAFEYDWNTNLPYSTEPEKILSHIIHNKGDDSISDDDVLRAIKMVCEAAKADKEAGTW